MQLLSNDRTLLAGRTGSGKTTFLKQLLKNYPKLFLWDFKHEHGNLGTIIKSEEKLKSLLNGNKWTRIIFQPNNPLDQEMFERICGYLYKLKNCLLVFEEVHTYATKHYMPYNFGALITTGRTRGLGCVMTTQRSALLNNTVITQCENLILFKMSDIDAEAFDGTLGSHYKELVQLPFYWYLTYGVRETEMKQFDNNSILRKKL